ncbi:hypothetical protein [Rhizobium sp. AC27/96]|uniref:hypothetical protein n=1 Tax=Rhizobium sp. AC27/96 TaxID=1841653 RepID=UPI001146C7DF|nr:hypothetical protein [Rhizobium sp. AC27/96]
MVSRLTNRLEGHPRLQAENSEQDAALLELVRSLGVAGSVFHILNEVLEQGEDLYTLLCDDQLVISFEVPRGQRSLQAKEFVEVSATEYRHKMGQGKNRIRLDETLKNARALLAGGA